MEEMINVVAAASHPLCFRSSPLPSLIHSAINCDSPETFPCHRSQSFLADQVISSIIGSPSGFLVLAKSTDHYMEPAQHGVQDVLNISTKVHVFHRSRLDLDHARLEKDHARLEKDHARLDVDHDRLDLDHARLDVDHARLDLDHARLDLGGEETEDRHAFSSGGPSGQSRKRSYRYPVHPSGSDEPGHLD
ncbi:hypothetical protein F2Q69_00046418 [Brassica cretica]|uniref:Uncharacterized protein n=1 Tax=Brassica cretica TaxID=69181 RepID=A0A8S9PTB8_BRACR|nr:hypothetical protein F2Q69_00046418 [Brassica cretica]